MKALDITIRAARTEDADFLSWVILTSGRAHVRKGIWEVILDIPEKRSLQFLKLLSITKIPHFFHYSCYLLADAGHFPVAGLGGYDSAVSGNQSLMKALPEVFQAIRGLKPDDFAADKTPRILNCMPGPIEGAWIIDSVAALPEYRRRGIVSQLLEEIMEQGKHKGFKQAQINIYIGNIAAQRLYEKHGFIVMDEIRDPYFEAQIGSPGMARMVKRL